MSISKNSLHLNYIYKSYNEFKKNIDNYDKKTYNPSYDGSGNLHICGNADRLQ